MPTKSNFGPDSSLPTTSRVDLAHSAVPTEEPLAAPDDLLEAIAGYDPASSTQQLRGQALELASMLREKQRLLEQRESELNARTALLERDLRSVRLKQQGLTQVEEPADRQEPEAIVAQAAEVRPRWRGLDESVDLPDSELEPAHELPAQSQPTEEHESEAKPVYSDPTDSPEKRHEIRYGSRSIGRRDATA